MLKGCKFLTLLIIFTLFPFLAPALFWSPGPLCTRLAPNSRPLYSQLVVTESYVSHLTIYIYKHDQNVCNYDTNIQKVRKSASGFLKTVFFFHLLWVCLVVFYSRFLQGDSSEK